MGVTVSNISISWNVVWLQNVLKLCSTLLVMYLTNVSVIIPEILETTDSVLLSLLMRTNGKGKNSHAPSTGLSGIRISVRTQYS